MAIFFSPNRFISGTSLGNLYVRLTINPSDFLRGTAAAQQGLGRLASAAVTTGAAFAALAAVSLREYALFNKAMTNSLSIMDNVSRRTREQMEATARELSTRSVKSARELAEGYFFLASAGLDAEQSMKALPVVARFATAGTIDMVRATNLLVNAQSALGLTSKDATENMAQMSRISDVLAKADMEATGTIEEFGDALTNKAAASMRQFGVELEEGVAVLMAFAAQGLRGKAAGESFHMLLRDLQKAALNNAKNFKRFGIEVYDANRNLRFLPDVIADIEKSFEGLSDAEKRERLNLMGFQDRALKAILAATGMSDAMKKFKKDLDAAGGSTEIIAKKQLEGFIAQLTIAWHKLQDLMITFGKELAPAVTDFVNELVNAVNATRDLQTETGFLTASIQTVVDIVKIFIIGVQTAYFGIKVLANLLWAGLVVQLEAVHAAITLTLTPIRTLLGLLGNLILTIWDLTKVLGSGLGDVFKNLFSGNFTGAAEAAKKALFEIGTIATEIPGRMAEPIKDSAAAAEKAWEDLTKTATETGSEMSKFVKKDWEEYSTRITKLTDGMSLLGDSTKKNMEKVKTSTEEAIVPIKRMADVVQDLKQSLDTLSPQGMDIRGEKLVEMLGTPRNAMPIQKTSAKELMESMYSKGADIQTDEAAKILERAGISARSGIYKDDSSMFSGGAFQEKNVQLEEQKRIVELLEEMEQYKVKFTDKTNKLIEESLAAHNEKVRQLTAEKNIILMEAHATLASSLSDSFGTVAGSMKQMAGESSGIYKTMFGMSKAFALAEAIINIQMGIAKALGGMPYPANLAAVAQVVAAAASIVSTITSVRLEFGGERAKGGPVSSGKSYLVGEKGPEMFSPGSSGNIIPNNQLAGRGVSVVVNNYTDAQATVTERQSGNEKVIEVMIRRVKNEISSEISDGRGDVHRAMSKTWGLKRSGR